MNEEKFNKRRQEILEAAFKKKKKKGYQNTKISDITNKLKMGHGTFYRYFKNKVDIFVFAFDEMFLKLQGILEIEPPDKANDLESYFEQVIRIAAMIADVYKKEFISAKIYYYEVLGSDKIINEKNDEAAKVFCHFAKLYLQNGVDKGFIRSDINIEVISKILQGTVISALREVLAASPDSANKVTEKWITAIISLLQKGIAA